MFVVFCLDDEDCDSPTETMFSEDITYSYTDRLCLDCVCSRLSAAETNHEPFVYSLQVLLQNTIPHDAKTNDSGSYKTNENKTKRMRHH